MRRGLENNKYINIRESEVGITDLQNIITLSLDTAKNKQKILDLFYLCLFADGNTRYRFQEEVGVGLKALNQFSGNTIEDRKNLGYNEFYYKLIPHFFSVVLQNHPDALQEINESMEKIADGRFYIEGVSNIDEVTACNLMFGIKYSEELTQKIFDEKYHLPTIAFRKLGAYIHFSLNQLENIFGCKVGKGTTWCIAKGEYQEFIRYVVTKVYPERAEELINNSVEPIEYMSALIKGLKSPKGVIKEVVAQVSDTIEEEAPSADSIDGEEATNVDLVSSEDAPRADLIGESYRRFRKASNTIKEQKRASGNFAPFERLKAKTAEKPKKEVEPMPMPTNPIKTFETITRTKATPSSEIKELYKIVNDASIGKGAGITRHALGYWSNLSLNEINRVIAGEKLIGGITINEYALRNGFNVVIDSVEAYNQFIKDVFMKIDVKLFEKATDVTVSVKGGVAPAQCIGVSSGRGIGDW